MVRRAQAEEARAQAKSSRRESPEARARRAIKRVTVTNKSTRTADLPEMTPERVELVRRGYEVLTSVCDGAREKDRMGFNAPDAANVHALAQVTATTTDPELREPAYQALYLVIRKYKDQLNNYGIQLDA